MGGRGRRRRAFRRSLAWLRRKESRHIRKAAIVKLARWCVRDARLAHLKKRREVIEVAWAIVQPRLTSAALLAGRA